MTRKDYVLIAAALNAAKPRTVAEDFMADKAYTAWLSCVCSMAHKLSHANARFDTARFLTACRGES